MSINLDAIPFEAYKGTDPYIFVSYSHKDTRIVFTDIKRLHDKGYRIWYDEGISPTKEWSEEIATAIEKSAIFIYFVSPRSVDSKHCRNEAYFALDEGKPFLAIHIEETNLSKGLMLRMNSTQAVKRHLISTKDYYKKVDKVLDEFNVKDITVTLSSQSASEPTTLISSNVSPTIDKETLESRPTNIIIEHWGALLMWWLMLPTVVRFIITAFIAIVLTVFLFSIDKQLWQQGANTNSNTSIQNQNRAVNESTGNKQLLNENTNITTTNTPNNGGEFKIDFRFDNNLTQRQKNAFSTAASRWEKVIVGDLPDAQVDGETVDDVLIEVESVSIDGYGNEFSLTEPTIWRSDSNLPVKGIIKIDKVDIIQIEKFASLEDFITHEIGEVLGIGKIDNWMKRIQGANTNNPVFIGKNARREYAALLGVAETSGVPVENTERVKNAGWRESVFRNEIMAGSGGYRDLISRVTVGALEDMGYKVNYNGAENYDLPPKPLP